MSRDRFGFLSTGELRHLLSNEQRLTLMVQLSEQVHSLQLKQESTAAGNEALAQINLRLKPRLESGKHQLTRKYQQLLEATVACDYKQQKLEVQLEAMGPSTALERLRKETSQAEQESEELRERFLGGSVSLETFLDKFQSLRTLSHIRRTQGDKLQELIMRGQRPEQPRPPDPQAPGSLVRSRYPEVLSPVLSPSPPPHVRNLPPLSSRAKRVGLFRPNTPFAPRSPGSGLNPDSLWTTKAYKLQRPPHPVQKQPPYR